MNTSPAPTDIADVLKEFGYPADQDTRQSIFKEIHDVEQTARRQMRALLRPDEFARVAALADASAAAQTILTRLNSHH